MGQELSTLSDDQDQSVSELMAYEIDEPSRPHIGFQDLSLDFAPFFVPELYFLLGSTFNRQQGLPGHHWLNFKIGSLEARDLRTVSRSDPRLHECVENISLAVDVLEQRLEQRIEWASVDRKEWQSRDSKPQKSGQEVNIGDLQDGPQGIPQCEKDSVAATQHTMARKQLTNTPTGVGCHQPPGQCDVGIDIDQLVLEEMLGCLGELSWCIQVLEEKHEKGHSLEPWNIQLPDFQSQLLIEGNTSQVRLEEQVPTKVPAPKITSRD